MELLKWLFTRWWYYVFSMFLFFIIPYTSSGIIYNPLYIYHGEVFGALFGAFFFGALFIFIGMAIKNNIPNKIVGWDEGYVEKNINTEEK